MDLMYDGKMNGYLPGLQPSGGTGPTRTTEALSAQTLITMDRSPPKLPGSVTTVLNDVDAGNRHRIISSPTGCFAEDGAIVNSALAAVALARRRTAGEARLDADHVELFLHLSSIKPRVALSRPDRQPLMALCPCAGTGAEEIAKEYNGRALVDIADAKDPAKIVRKAGEQIAAFAELKDDGSTSCG